MNTIMIKDLSVCHGKKVVGNEVYVEHFKKRGKDIEHFLKDVIGRDKRYMFDSTDQNTLTLSVEAAEDVLRKTGLTGADLDMIILSSQLPEYIAPPTSIKIHGILKGKQECICYDMNSNCCGMALAFEQASKYMSVSPNINRAMIIGCDYINLIINPEEEGLYGHYGDSACAVIIEKSDRECGLIDSQCIVKSVYSETALIPGCGFSNMFSTEDRKNLMIRFTPPEEVPPESALETISAILDRNNLDASDISMYCLSQYALINIQKIRDLLNVDDSQCLYIGDIYGYTGTSSPFITLYESINRGLLKRGDYFIIWTIGCGSQNIGILCKY